MPHDWLFVNVPFDTIRLQLVNSLKGRLHWRIRSDVSCLGWLLKRVRRAIVAEERALAEGATRCCLEEAADLTSLLRVLFLAGPVWCACSLSWPSRQIRYREGDLCRVIDVSVVIQAMDSRWCNTYYRSRRVRDDIIDEHCDDGFFWIKKRKTNQRSFFDTS